MGWEQSRSKRPFRLTRRRLIIITSGGCDSQAFETLSHSFSLTPRLMSSVLMTYR